MYNRNYYAQVDDAMMKLWKDFGRRLLHVLDGTMRYVLTLPIRTYEYIGDEALKHFGEFMPNTIHVRNHNYHKDYEILQVNQSFCDLHPDEEDE